MVRNRITPVTSFKMCDARSARTLLSYTLNNNSAFKNDFRVALDQLSPDQTIRPLQYNARNRRLGKQRLGGNKWLAYIIDHMRDMDYAELRSIIGTTGSPVIPEFISRRQKQAVSLRKGASPTVSAPSERPGCPQRLRDRAQGVADLIRDCDRRWTAAVTVNTSYALTKEQAIEAFYKDAKRLEQFIRRRFPDAIFVLEPEFDQKLVKDVQRDRYAKANWKLGLDPNQQIYTIHFHGVIYAPGLKPKQIGQMFKLTANGKRSRFYSGATQVRALPLYEETGTDDKPDVYNFLLYAEKCHYRPPVMKRMLEGAAEWLWLTDKIQTDPQLIILGGTRKPIRIHCPTCNANFDINDSCNCIANNVPKNNLVINDFVKSQVMPDSDSILRINHYPNPISSNIYPLSLNCICPTNETATKKQVNKKYGVLVKPILRLTRKIWHFFAPVRGP